MKKAVFSLVAISLACSALLLPVTPAHATPGLVYQQDISLQAPSDPPLPGHHPPFPPPLPPHPFPPMPPTPPNPWTHGPWQWPITWRWSPYIRTIPPVQQGIVVERPVVQPVYAPVISSFTASP
ncbi:MAG: hypothetical protein PHO26_06405, partial [Dehalococcoidia bacterium]|nr:hypothetical protein [Dehalococcoidia bacterium]